VLAPAGRQELVARSSLLRLEGEFALGALVSGALACLGTYPVAGVRNQSREPSPSGLLSAPPAPRCGRRFPNHATQRCPAASSRSTPYSGKPCSHRGAGSAQAHSAVARASAISIRGPTTVTEPPLG